jgi:hypothetical protein
MQFDMRSVPPREWLAVVLPLLFGAILLGAGGAAAADGDAWVAYVLAAGIGAAVPLFYAGLGGAALGIWPGLFANFLRLRREEWVPSAATRRSRERQFRRP